MKSYNIMRFFKTGNREIIKTRLTLREAQEHCKHPSSSSETCTDTAGLLLKNQLGQWFDGFTENNEEDE